MIDRSEAMLLGFSILFQIVSLITLLRVATGVAAANSTTSPSQVVVLPSFNQSVSVPSSTPQFVNPAGSGLDSSLLLAALFVIANIVVVSLLAFLYRKKRMKWFSIVISVFLIFNVTELYFSFIAGLYSILPIVAAIVASVITIWSAVKGHTNVVNILALFLALESEVPSRVLLQAPLSWIVPAVYSFFDIYAIYYGRLGKLVKQVGDAENESKKEIDSKPETVVRAPKKSRLGKWPDFRSSYDKFWKDRDRDGGYCVLYDGSSDRPDTCEPYRFHRRHGSSGRWSCNFILRIQEQRSCPRSPDTDSVWLGRFARDVFNSVALATIQIRAAQKIGENPKAPRHNRCSVPRARPSLRSEIFPNLEYNIRRFQTRLQSSKYFSGKLQQISLRELKASRVFFVYFWTILLESLEISRELSGIDSMFRPRSTPSASSSV